MSKVAVVYWSSTGNTEIMANEIVEGAKEAGADVTLFNTPDFEAAKMDDFDVVAFGCPAMGDEELEEDEFLPLFEACEEKLQGKKIALFGSYGWGEGDWMNDWEERCKGKGAELVTDCLIVNEEPDEEGKESCRNFGKALA